MTSDLINRQISRRRLAALTFLSNISLDGTHNDTNLGKYYNREQKVSSDKENINFPENVHMKVENEPLQCTSEFLFEVDHSVYNKKFGEEADRSTDLPKKSCQLSSERSHYFSSSESVGPTIPGLGSRKRNISGTLSEISGSTNREARDTKLDRIKEERLVFLSQSRTPFHLFSCLPYTRQSKPEYHSHHRDYHSHHRDTLRKRHTSGNRPISVVSVTADPAHILGLSCFEDTAEVSFADLLHPSKNFVRGKRNVPEHDEQDYAPEKSHHHALARCFSYEASTHKATAHFVSAAVEREEKPILPCLVGGVNYVPNQLDDPDLIAGKHKKILCFRSYLTSITDYTKSSDLKREVNDKFRIKFPYINLTLSKLRSLKREMVKIMHYECELDLAMVAQAFVYFEKMILKGHINKQTRKLIAGACLILSAKMNDVKGDCLTTLIEKIEGILRLNRKELLEWELSTAVALEFGLHIPVWQVNPHYQRLLYEI